MLLIVTIFPPFLGGQHLTNLLGLQYNIKDVNEHEINTYYRSNIKDAHVYEEHFFSHPNKKPLDLTTSCIRCGHFPDFCYFYTSQKENLNTYKTKKMVVIRVPDSIDSLGSRAEKVVLGDSSVYSHYKEIYGRSTLAKLFPEFDIVEVGSENLFNENLLYVQGDLQSQGMNLDLKYQYLHTLWYNKVK